MTKKITIWGNRKGKKRFSKRNAGTAKKPRFVNKKKPEGHVEYEASVWDIKPLPIDEDLDEDAVVEDHRADQQFMGAFPSRLNVADYDRRDMTTEEAEAFLAERINVVGEHCRESMTGEIV